MIHQYVTPNYQLIQPKHLEQLHTALYCYMQETQLQKHHLFLSLCTLVFSKPQ